MAQIASEDYVNLRIYLHADTVSQGFDPAAMQREHRALRRLDANGERAFDPMVSFSGNESKGGGNFTAGLTILRSGVRIVPFDANHSLDLLNEIVNIDDAISDRDVFDRSLITSSVDIDPVYSPVEIREVSSGSGLSVDEQAQLLLVSRIIQADMYFDKTAGLLHYYDPGTTIDIIPPKQVSGEEVAGTVQLTT
ncbi:MAG: hypothetical protein AAF358_13690 [Pseudomonadota bacterium]